MIVEASAFAQLGYRIVDNLAVAPGLSCFALLRESMSRFCNRACACRLRR